MVGIPGRLIVSVVDFLTLVMVIPLWLRGITGSLVRPSSRTTISSSRSVLLLLLEAAAAVDNWFFTFILLNVFNFKVPLFSAAADDDDEVVGEESGTGTDVSFF